MSFAGSSALTPKSKLFVVGSRICPYMIVLLRRETLSD
jgi:hypothetical protein